MPLFQYEALSESGKKLRGKIFGENVQSAKVKLIQQGIAAISIRSLPTHKKNFLLKKKEVLLFTKELSRLLDAALPLFEAVSALEEKYQGHKLHPFLLQMSEKLQGGIAFSKILQEYGSSFDLIYVAMIANSEKTGSLPQALHKMADLMQKQMKAQKQLISALLYPALLMLFCFVVLSSLLFFVIPSLKELFEGRDLHPFTQIVFYASDLAVRSQHFLLILFPLAVILILAAVFMENFKRKARNLFVKAPFLKPMFAKVAFIRFSRAVSTLIEGGLPLVESLFEAEMVLNHQELKKIVEKAKEALSQGEPLSKSFSKQKLIPPLVPRMLAIAEESGSLAYTFTQIAEIYEEELEQQFTHFSTLLQPLLLVFLGALVGFVLLSVLLPLTDVSSFLN